MSGQDSDRILLALFDPAISDPKDYTFQAMKRKNMQLETINRVFKIDAWYIKDPFGVILLPDQWSQQVYAASKAGEWFYIIHEKIAKEPRDDTKSNLYSGASTLVAYNVPRHVKRKDIRTWLLRALLNIHPTFQKARDQLEQLRFSQQKCQHKINNFSSSAANASQNALLLELQKQKNQYDTDRKTFTLKYVEMEKRFLSERLVIASADSKSKNDITESEKSPRKNWIISFASDKAQELVPLALEYSQWSHLDDDMSEQLLKVGSVQTGRNSMRLVEISRVRHGDGELVRLSDKQQKEEANNSLHAELKLSSMHSMYVGSWFVGEKHGQGLDISKVGMYAGEFVHGTRAGVGKFVYADGSSIEGQFDDPFRFYEHHTELKGSRYQFEKSRALLSQGCENGTSMVIQFPDGAKYEGKMRDGRICGEGRYVSSTGNQEEGCFLNGLLHGEQCTRTFSDGSLEAGSFEHGELHGAGTRRESNGDLYEGYFEHGMKSGYGRSVVDDGKFRHIGFWSNNSMNGRGDLYHISSESARKLNRYSRFPKSWSHWYEGQFLDNEARPHHRLADMRRHSNISACFTSKGNILDPMQISESYLQDRLTLITERNKQALFLSSRKEKDHLHKRTRENSIKYQQHLHAVYESWMNRKNSSWRQLQELNGEDTYDRIVEPLKRFESCLDRCPPT